MRLPRFETDLLPPGWIRDYVEMHEGYDIVPPVLHAFAALVGFGNIFIRRVRILRGGMHAIDPAQSGVIVSPSGSGKTLAISRIERMVTAVATGHPTTGGKATMEGILSRLDPEFARGLITAPELGSMFGKQTFRTGFELELTDLLDNAREYKWHTKGAMDLPGKGVYNYVALSLLGATTKEDLVERFPGTALEKGFASRVLFIYSEDLPRYMPFLPPTVPGWDASEKKLKDFWHARIKPVSPREPITLALDDPNCPIGRVWKAWADEHQLRKPIDDPWRAGWWNRQPVAYLQLALILSLSEAVQRGPDAPIELSMEAMAGANRLLLWAESGIQVVHELMGGMSERRKIKDYLLRKLMGYGGWYAEKAFPKVVSYRVDGGKRVIDILMDELQDEGRVTKEMRGGHSGWLVVHDS